MDYVRKAMFVVNLYSPNDKLNLEYNTSHYPRGLVQYLEEEKDRIDKGFYSIKTWQMELYTKQKNKKLNFLNKLEE
ncbi:UNVERIFIED_ORG: hypothetical protein J2X74_000249 [Bacillus sp. 1751]|nr:hypothetical protein [Bacillus sp. 1751]